MTARLLALFPHIDLDLLNDRIFHLTYKQYGGSGTNLTYTEVLELDWSHMEWWFQRLMEEREREAKAMRDASRKK